MPTQEKSRTSVKFARKCFHGGQFWPNTNVCTTETKLKLTHTKAALLQNPGYRRKLIFRNLEVKFPRIFDCRTFI